MAGEVKYEQSGSLVGEIVLYTWSSSEPPVPAIVVSEKMPRGDVWWADLFVFGLPDFMGGHGMVTANYEERAVGNSWRFRGPGAPEPEGGPH